MKAYTLVGIEGLPVFVCTESAFKVALMVDALRTWATRNRPELVLLINKWFMDWSAGNADLCEIEALTLN